MSTYTCATWTFHWPVPDIGLHAAHHGCLSTEGGLGGGRDDTMMEYQARVWVNGSVCISSMLHRCLQQYVYMFIVYIHIHCIVCTYTKSSTISLHITTTTFSTNLCRHMTHTQHWGAPHTPDDGLDDKVLDGLPNGVSVQVQLCSHVLPERKESPVWRGGGERGEGGKGHAQAYNHVCTYICSDTCIQMDTQYISSRVETSYECVRTCLMHTLCTYVFCISKRVYTIK